MKIRIINDSPYDLPSYATPQSAGCDLRAFIETGRSIPPGGSLVVPTGIHIALPEGYEAQVRGRSGLNFKHGVVVFTGTVDADYRAGIGVKLYNLSHETFVVNPGDRIAQLVIARCEKAEWEEAMELDMTERGNSGFGSSGIK